MVVAACGDDRVNNPVNQDAAIQLDSSVPKGKCSVTDLGIGRAGASSFAPSATAVDEGGNVAGRHVVVDRQTTAFRWSAGTGAVGLGTLGGTYSASYGIAGAFTVGVSGLANGEYRGFLSDASGLHELATLGGAGVDGSRAFAVNASGLAVGDSRLANGFRHAASWQDGAVNDLGARAGTAQSNSRALAINAGGVMVGSSETSAGLTEAVMWAGGTIHSLGSGEATGINAAGDIAIGYLDGPVMYRGGAAIPIPIPPVSMGTTSGRANGVNDAGWVVGRIHEQRDIEGPGMDYGYLYDSTSQSMYELTSMISEDGWVIKSANAVNNAGQIAADAVHSSGHRAVLLKCAL
jgi:probable HAF family extracellular repeat protein